MKIQETIIDNNSPTYFIADIAANHDGDLERAKDLIFLAAESGADAAKFQHFQAKTIVSDKGFKSLGKQASHQASWKKSVFEVYKEASVDLSWTMELKDTCKKANIPFFTTPYSLEVVDYINEFVPAFKIGSGDITWLEIILKVAKKNKPYIIATGASSQEDVDLVMEKCLPINKQICLMQCNTNYTASLENFKYINLNVLKTYKNFYPEILLGLSDHTPGHATVLGAVALGAKMIEKHFTDDNNREGPDHKFSMNPKSWREMVDRTRELDISLGSEKKQIEDNERETIILQRRSIRTTRNLKEGHFLKREDIIPLRPCPQDAINPFFIDQIIGKKIRQDISQGDYLKQGDLLL